MHLNLLPPKVRQAGIVRARAKQWTLAWSITAILAGGAWWLKAGQRDQLAAGVDQLELAYAPLDKLWHETQRLRTGRTELKQRELVFNELQTLRPPLALIGLVSRSAKLCDGRIRVQNLVMRVVEQTAPPVDKQAVDKLPTLAITGPAASVTLKGIGYDDLAIARFVMALEETKAFDRVELKSSVDIAPGDDRACSYIVECTY